jgi:hypothetical protein
MAMDALRNALCVRKNAQVPLQSPFNIFDHIENIGIPLWFNDIPSLEGMYCSHPRNILIGAHRPIGRKRYTAAHEYAHDIYGHGTRVDEYVEDEQDDNLPDEEFMANCFAGFLLMPKLAVQHGFASSGWRFEDFIPWQYYTVSLSLGVTYTALISQMRYSLNMLPSRDLNQLIRTKPKAIKLDLLGDLADIGGEVMIIQDTSESVAKIDVEMGDVIFINRDLSEVPVELCAIGENSHGFAYRVQNPGIAMIEGNSSTICLRSSPRYFFGRSKYRHIARWGDDEHSH